MTNSRAKGRAGETKARHMWEDRDFTCEDMSGGRTSCDFLAIKDGTIWAVEVKDRAIIDMRCFRAQARMNAKKGIKWAVAAHIPDTRAWIIERQGTFPVLWYEKGDALCAVQEGDAL